MEKRPATNFTVRHEEIQTVKNFVPASKGGPAVKFTLRLKSVRTNEIWTTHHVSSTSPTTVTDGFKVRNKERVIGSKLRITSTHVSNHVNRLFSHVPTIYLGP